MTDQSHPATKEDINEIHSRFYSTELAIAFILSSLSKQVDLDPVFDAASDAASTLGEERERHVYEIIHSIRCSVKEARASHGPGDSEAGIVVL